MKKILVTAITAVAAMVVPIWAQPTLQPYKIVDAHSAGTLPKAVYDLEFKFYPAGNASYSSGMLTAMHVGISNKFNVGLSYGGEGIIGRGNNVKWNKLPGIMVKYRLFDESFALPALAIGFDNQGYGGIAEEWYFGYDGYIYKSPGFFAAISKNFLMLGSVQIGFHGLVNYSFEGADDVSWPNALVGVDIGINEELALVGEYDFAFNDITGMYNDDKYGRPFHGFLNLGLRWAFSSNFHMELQLKDVLENKTRIIRRDLLTGTVLERERNGWSRELKIVYIGAF